MLLDEKVATTKNQKVINDPIFESYHSQYVFANIIA
jgi:hypothetical protein